jgi:hypothetical protein
VVRKPIICAWLAAWTGLVGLGCRDRPAARPDGGSDSGQGETANPLTLVIAVSGCASYYAMGGCGDPDAPCCRGTAPLALSFAPVGSPELTQFRWSFGDGTAPATERVPSHVYAHPGEYQVTLVGGSSEVGMVSPPHALRVSVARLGAGVPCDVDVQCGDGLQCLCGPGSGCSSAFARGLCSKACESAACGPGAACAALTVAPRPDGGARPPLCIAACQTDTQCPPGYVCQTVRDGSTAPDSPWTRGCLPLGAARDLGDTCRDATDQLSNESCTTSVCADVGALGACSTSCANGTPCPETTACALLGDGRQLCLRSGCTSDADCGPDPLLACALLGPSGEAPTVTVCAPKNCTGDNVCAPSGRCGPDGACVRR